MYTYTHTFRSPPTIGASHRTGPPHPKENWLTTGSSEDPATYVRVTAFELTRYSHEQREWDRNSEIIG